MSNRIAGTGLAVLLILGLAGVQPDAVQAEDERMPVEELLTLIADDADAAPSEADDVWGGAPVVRAERGTLECGTLVREDAHRRRTHTPRSGLTLRIEGGLSWSEDPEGSVGLDTGLSNQLEWDEIEYDTSTAFRVGAAWCACGWAIEAGYAQLADTDGDAATNGVFGFSPPPGSTAGPTAARLDGELELASARLTAWRPVCCGRCLDWGVGFGARAIRLREVLSASGLAIPGGGTGSVEGDAESLFLGGELGAYVTWRMGRRLSLRAQVTALLGTVERDISVRDVSIFSPGAHRATSNESAFAWGANLGVTATWRLSRRLAVTAAYDLLFLDGVARGADVFDFGQAGSGAVQADDAEGQLLTHSVFLGLEFRF